MLAPVPVVGIDCRFASLPVGIGRYTRELVHSLVKRNDPWTYVLFVKSKDESWIPKSNRIAVREVSIKHYSLKEQFVLPVILKKSKIDLYFNPQFNVPLRCPVPFIATVHDLILHRYANESGLLKHIAYQILMRHTVQNAEKVLTVSNATKKELSEKYGSNEKIIVSYPGISFGRPADEYIQKIRSKHQLPETYFLYVGSAKEHKNVQRLIDLFEKSSDDDAKLVLLLFGKEADQLNFSKKTIRMPKIPDSELASLYSAATGFISMTKYEGFGLPFLEAMACKCPVMGLDIPVLQEICAGNAILIPDTEEAFSLGLKALATRDERSIDRAYEHARSFTWEKTASNVASVLEEALR